MKYIKFETIHKIKEFKLNIDDYYALSKERKVLNKTIIKTTYIHNKTEEIIREKESKDEKYLLKDNKLYIKPHLKLYSKYDNVIYKYFDTDEDMLNYCKSLREDTIKWIDY